MRKWFMTGVLVVLAAGIAFNTYLSWRLVSRADSLSTQVTSLEGSLATLNVNTTQLVCDLETHCELVTTTVSQVRPVVVRINANGRGFSSAGSGVIVSSDGYVVTNHHVVADAVTVAVTLVNGETHDAEIVTSDSQRDLAVVKMNSSRTDFTAAALGSSASAVTGAEVMVAGFPLGSDLSGPATFTRGIVSAVRRIGGLNFIQSDAAVNPGNSGGCMVTLDGKVIGIIVAILQPEGEDVEGISLAIPIDEVIPMIEQYTGG